MPGLDCNKLTISLLFILLAKYMYILLVGAREGERMGLFVDIVIMTCI